MKNIKIFTCNSVYKNNECSGGYHEIHNISYLSGIGHLCATINSIIDNNKAYGCSDTVLESVVVSCDRKTADIIKEHYQTPYKDVNVSTEVIYT